MRVLSTAWECPNGWYGGLGVYLSRFLPEVAREHEVTHYCYHGNCESLRPTRYRGVKVVRLHEPYVDALGGVANLQALAFARDLLHVVHEYDVLHGHDIHSSLLVVAVRELGIKSIYYVHAPGYLMPLDFVGVFYADTVVSNSKLTARMILSHYGEGVSGKLRVVYPAPPYEPMDAYPEKPRRERPLVVIPSRLQFNKDPSHVLKELEEARRRVPFDVLVFGRGSEYYSLPEWIAKLGSVSEEEKLEIYRSADLVLQVGFPEPFGLVALEAVALGTPVLVSSQSGVAEVLPREAVYSKEDLAERLVRLLSDPTAREELWWAERRSPAMLRTWADVWSEVRSLV